MTYCFRCPTCGETAQQGMREPVPECFTHNMKIPQPMVRDYQAESVGIGPGVRASREVGK